MLTRNVNLARLTATNFWPLCTNTAVRDTSAERRGHSVLIDERASRAWSRAPRAVARLCRARDLCPVEVLFFLSLYWVADKARRKVIGIALKTVPKGTQEDKRAAAAKGRPDSNRSGPPRKEPA